jgi:hypothetical protein
MSFLASMGATEYSTQWILIHFLTLSWLWIVKEFLNCSKCTSKVQDEPFFEGISLDLNHKFCYNTIIIKHIIYEDAKLFRAIYYNVQRNYHCGHCFGTFFTFSNSTLQLAHANTKFRAVPQISGFKNVHPTKPALQLPICVLCSFQQPLSILYMFLNFQLYATSKRNLITTLLEERKTILLRKKTWVLSRTFQVKI